MSEKYDNSGIVFENKRKESANHPDRTGYATIGGVEYWISGWLKKNDKGPFLSLAFKVKEAKEEPKPTRKATDKDFDSDIPFN